MTDLFAFETVTVGATAASLTAATYAPAGAPGATCAYLTLADGQVRWRADGTDPDASTGHLLEVGDTLVLTGAATLRGFRAIRTGGVSGTLSVSYGR